MLLLETAVGGATGALTLDTRDMRSLQKIDHNPGPS
jgi:hypothetical protein